MSQVGIWHPAAKLGELNELELLGIDIGGIQVALYLVGSDVYATGNICTHAQALLSEGLLEGCEIECPLHNGRFDIRTGKALSSPVNVDIPTYPVRVVNDMIEVCLPS